MQVQGANNCSSVPYVKVNSTEHCSSMIYNGSLCSDVLTRWRQCTTESNAVDDGITRIQTLNSTIEAVEAKISQLLNTSSNDNLH